MESRPHASSSSTAEGKKRERSPGGDRRPLAIMACETCRARKSRCDEQRPRCGLCQKLGKTCIYQEPKPTKKDNTLALILDTVNSLNLKIDRVLAPELLATHRNQARLHSTAATSPTVASTTVSSGPGSRGNVALTPTTTSTQSVDVSASASASTSHTPAGLLAFQVPPQQMTGVHRVLAWPAVQRLLRYDGTDVSQWEGEYKDTEHWLLGISKDFGVPLPLDWSVDIYYSDAGILNLEKGRSIALNREYVENLCRRYFESFHCTYPILDREHFFSQVLPQVLQTSFSESQEGTCLVLLVLALGSMAQEGVSGASIVDQSGRQTGIRGGTVERPPGLVYLNEARRRFGVNLTNWNLANLQTSILLSVYYSQTSRNLEFWRMAILSCTMCQGLVKSVVQWDTVYSDRIARCFWMCSIIEGGLTGELGLDLPAIQALQDSVPLPLFLSEPSQLGTKTEDDLIIEYHFLAQVTLRTLINRARTSIKESKGSLFLEDDQGSKSRDYIMQELSAQLDNWRSHLPSAIAWEEETGEDVTMNDPDMNVYREATTPVDPAITGNIDFKHILNSSLRTRYKYAEYIIWRPYIYQILHFPSDSTEHNYVCCQKAIKAYCLWPLTFATFQPQRRLIPHLYEYTHTFFTILVLIHVCSSSPVLGPMLQAMPRSQEIDISISLYLSWIRDMKVVHPVARWCWHLLKYIYKDHQLVREDRG